MKQDPITTNPDLYRVVMENDRAKERQPSGLQLWTFQVNAGARRFYERHGFRAVEMTDGAGNEERQPDVRYAWK